MALFRCGGGTASLALADVIPDGNILVNNNIVPITSASTQITTKAGVFVNAMGATGTLAFSSSAKWGYYGTFSKSTKTWSFTDLTGSAGFSQSFQLGSDIGAIWIAVNDTTNPNVNINYTAQA